MTMTCRAITARTALSLLTCLSASASGFAQIIDPEAYISKVGPKSARLGDDGVTKFYSFTERAAPDRIVSLEREIAALPKREEVFNVCNQMRGSIKAKLIGNSGKPIDVAAVNYGYSGSTIACSLKYMHKSEVGTQLIFMKKAAAGMYMVFITD